MKDIEDKEMHIFAKAINKYINLLNSQMEAFPIIMNTLVFRLKACTERMNHFMDENGIKQVKNDNNVTITVPYNINKEFIRYNKEINQSLAAIQLIPKNVVVAFVSIYDAFLSDIIEGIYKICPELLNTCEKEYSFSDIIKFSSLDEIKEHIIEKEVESVLRESHIKQFEWLSRKINVKLTEDLPNYKHFIEITERRNLFVHTNGKISRQYLTMVSEKGDKACIDPNIKLGETLDASLEYVIHCYKILFEIGVKLGQVVWRKLDEKNSLEEADGHLIDVIYELLKNKKYNLGIILSEFATKSYIKDYNKSNELVKCINKSLAYYLNDNKEKCRSIINSIDWSATDYRFKLAAAVLEEKYADACELMKRIGNSDDMMEAYREWPLFSNFRESELFKDTFKEIYKIDFNYVEIKPLEWEDIIKGAIEYFNVKSNHHECEDMEYNKDESIDSTFTDESVINPN